MGRLGQDADSPAGDVTTAAALPTLSVRRAGRQPRITHTVVIYSRMFEKYGMQGPRWAQSPRGIQDARPRGPVRIHDGSKSHGQEGCARTSQGPRGSPLCCSLALVHDGPSWKVQDARVTKMGPFFSKMELCFVF